MDSKLLVDIFYYVVLYGSLATALIPLLFFIQWTFFRFWKKHVFLFYVFFFGTFVLAAAGFYFTQPFWIYYYYVFPQWLQMAGIFMVAAGYTVVKLAEFSITKKVRFFYPLLKDQKFHLVTTGVYKYFRHPMYAVFPWVTLGAMFYTGQLVLLPVMIFNIIARNLYVPVEEKYIRKMAIGDYDEYKKHTPFRFYPWHR